MSIDQPRLTQPTDSEVYIADNPHILAAMQQAAGNVVGMIASVLPSGEDSINAAIDSGNRLYEASKAILHPDFDLVDLHPDQRALDAESATEYWGGGVVRVEYTGEASPEEQRDAFRQRTVRNLLNQGEGFGGDRPTDVTDGAYRRYHNTTFLEAAFAREQLDLLNASRAAGKIVDQARVEKFENVIAQFEGVAAAVHAYKEIETVHRASAKARRI